MYELQVQSSEYKYDYFNVKFTAECEYNLSTELITTKLIGSFCLCKAKFWESIVSSIETLLMSFMYNYSSQKQCGRITVKIKVILPLPDKYWFLYS